MVALWSKETRKSAKTTILAKAGFEPGTLRGSPEDALDHCWATELVIDLGRVL